MSHSSQNYFFSSIGKKQVMAVTGLGLCGFVFMHFLGNLLILAGPDAFNTYAHTLTSNKLIYLAEAGLGALFLLHLVLAVILRIQNKLARPVKYYIKKNTGRGATFASQTMIFTGIILFIFLIVHLIGFKFGTHYSTVVNGVEMRDLYKLVVESFASPVFVGFYVFVMIVLGIHTSHGFWSAFQSLGINHPRYTPIIKIAAKVFAGIMTFGFSGLAIYCYFLN